MKNIASLQTTFDTFQSELTRREEYKLKLFEKQKE